MRNNGVGVHRTATAEDVRFRNDDNLFTFLCGILGDDISFAIIKSTIRECRPAIEISKGSKIPVSSVYKKIRKLQEYGIVRVEKIDIDTKSGKRIAFYRSWLKSLELRPSDVGETSLRGEAHASGVDSREDSNAGKEIFAGISKEE